MQKSKEKQFPRKLDLMMLLSILFSFLSCYAAIRVDAWDSGCHPAPFDCCTSVMASQFVSWIVIWHAWKINTIELKNEPEQH